MRTLPIVLVAAGCQTGSVVVRGTVFDGPGDDAAPIDGARIEFVDALDGKVLDSARTGNAGGFTVELPPGASVVAEIRGDGLATSTFPGVTGFDAELVIDDGVFFGVSLAEVADLRARFAGCPGAEEGGAIVYGEVRIFGLQDPESGESPLSNAARVDVFAQKNDSYAGCYSDADGRYDPAADRTGDTGQFAIFGVPGGLHDVDVRYELATDYWIGSVYPAWVPDRGEDVVVPMWPAWVQLQL